MFGLRTNDMWPSLECLVKLMELLGRFLCVLLRMRIDSLYHISMMNSAYMTLYVGRHVTSECLMDSQPSVGVFVVANENGPIN